MATDFVIVGGGIGGAVLANLLALGGRKVVVLEKNLRPAATVRPEVLWPATMRTLFSLVPMQDMVAADVAVPMRGVDFHDGKAVVSLIGPPALREAGIEPWFTNPDRTREALLATQRFELRRGVEVIGVLRDGGRVVGVRARDVVTGAEDDVLAGWTVGDDGSQSLVRKSCAIGMSVRMFPVEFLCFGFEWPDALPVATARVWPHVVRDASGILVMLAMPVSARSGAALVIASPELSGDLDLTRRAWAQLRGIDPAIDAVVGERRFPADFARIRRPWGHARRYGIDGALLVGDAAHPVSPAGGQGANMSVADARVLAQAALKGSRDLVADYERIRRPANERSLRPTRWAARLFSLPRWSLPPRMLLAGVRWMAARPRRMRHFLGFASTAFLEDP